MTDITHCEECPEGQYCDITGMEAPAGLCEAGYYCEAGSTSPAPEDSEEGGRCEAGYYCPAGSASPVQCPPGEYCDNDGLAEPTGNCMPGYFCDYGSTTPIPQKCDAGYYCPEGTQT
mmetsp:Transcript_27383/g.12751  ORF Transcript_27383/g.12751 Transcript_27383/m.12751 type:complete len:117 (+) Transcript_27383:269-619(+)|eukprot:CAMPEP_0201285810 /NCGR_PEP_ID=MMETSP1317-20130820/113852_1 /ASSEMBLY_ACC=CAM_ASM_000770 /TAXON_ID=187299 /ORGANISM="Undescribed Undescribed, Strain Undescribed" /LENGTH=116 /DNA_ID=CAMNT_0047611795 /DNA_START=244 /DNA_END=594 /DNA_ORIENTATION=+